MSNNISVIAIFFMKELDLKIFGARLKEVAKAEFGTIGELGDKAQITNLSTYTSGRREAGSNILYRLALLGIDINQLLLGEEMGEGLKEELEELKKEFKNFKEEIYDLRKENEKLKEEKKKLIFEITSLNKITSKKVNSP